jgi:hypothetical protein
MFRFTQESSSGSRVSPILHVLLYLFIFLIFNLLIFHSFISQKKHILITCKLAQIDLITADMPP